MILTTLLSLFSLSLSSLSLSSLSLSSLLLFSLALSLSLSLSALSLSSLSLPPLLLSRHHICQKNYATEILSPNVYAKKRKLREKKNDFATK